MAVLEKQKTISRDEYSSLKELILTFWKLPRALSSQLPREELLQLKSWEVAYAKSGRDPKFDVVKAIGKPFEAVGIAPETSNILNQADALRELYKHPVAHSNHLSDLSLELAKGVRAEMYLEAEQILKQRMSPNSNYGAWRVDSAHVAFFLSALEESKDCPNHDYSSSLLRVLERTRDTYHAQRVNMPTNSAHQSYQFLALEGVLNCTLRLKSRKNFNVDDFSRDLLSSLSSTSKIPSTEMQERITSLIIHNVAGVSNRIPGDRNFCDFLFKFSDSLKKLKSNSAVSAHFSTLEMLQLFSSVLSLESRRSIEARLIELSQANPWLVNEKQGAAAATKVKQSLLKGRSEEVSVKAAKSELRALMNPALIGLSAGTGRNLAASTRIGAVAGLAAIAANIAQSLRDRLPKTSRIQSLLDRGRSPSTESGAAPERARKREISTENDPTGAQKLTIIFTGGTISMTGTPLSAPKNAGQIEEFKQKVLRTIKDAAATEPNRSFNKFKQIDFVTIKPLDSTNIGFDERMIIARAVFNAHRAGSDAIVVLHGTDTLAKTSAHLSLLNFDSDDSANNGEPWVQRPVVLTGSQKPLRVELSDAKFNLLNAVEAAYQGYLNNIGDVMIVFSNSVIQGACAIKNSERDFDAFGPGRDTRCKAGHVDTNGVTLSSDVLHVTRSQRTKRPTAPNYKKMDRASAFFVASKENDPRQFPISAQRKKPRAVILQSVGEGNLPDEWSHWAKDATKSGVLVFLTSQFPGGAVGDGQYELGDKALKAGALPLGDMLTPVAEVKLQIGLAKELRGQALAKYMMSNIAGEMDKKPSQQNLKFGK